VGAAEGGHGRGVEAAAAVGAGEFGLVQEVQQEADVAGVPVRVQGLEGGDGGLGQAHGPAVEGGAAPLAGL
jgi:hypothetical protein